MRDSRNASETTRATPGRPRKAPLTFARRWTLIVLGLVAGAFVLFVVLMILHMHTLGRDWAP
jgi:hypothetical protein